MSITCYCDVCGSVGKKQRVWIYGWKKRENREFDLCKDCYNKILEILKVKE